MARPVKNPAARLAPDRDCNHCPRLRSFILAQRDQEPNWHNAPVPSFGPSDARLLIVGLAPGMRGANRTGRPFTGDHAGLVLYDGLLRHGLAVGAYRASPDDGLELRARVTNAVRCVPPQNKPIGQEIKNCTVFLHDELKAGVVPKVVLALGRIAHEAILRVCGAKLKAHPFVHNQRYALDDGPILISSYHFSRYNMNTRRLTLPMVDDVFEHVNRTLNDA